MNFTSLLTDYLNESTRLTAASRKTYSNRINYFIEWLKKNKIVNPTKQDLIRYQKSLYDKAAKKSQMSAKSANNYLVPVKRFFLYLEKKEIYENVASLIELEKIEKRHTKDSLNLDEAKHLITSIEEHYENMLSVQLEKRGEDSAYYKTYYKVNRECKLRDVAIATLAINTGLRLIEIVRADIGDIRTQKVRLEEKQYKKHVLYIQGKGKAEKSDFVYLKEDVYSTILDYLKYRYGNIQNKLDEPLFKGVGNRSNPRLALEPITRFFKKILRDSGIINLKDANDSRLSFHSFRHTAATLALDAGVPIEKVKQMLRHATITTTEIYLNGMERMIDPAEFSINLGE